MITYFLQTSLCWLFFLIVYKLFLKRETFFVNNRWYLLITLGIGLLFPFAREVWESSISTSINYVVPFQGGAQIFEISQIEVEKGIGYMQIIQTVFWLGFILFLSKLIKDTYSILIQIKRYPHIKYTNYTEIKTDYEHLPFSFFNYVFISDQLKFKDPEWNRILIHEISHVHGWHSLDILFVELIGTFFWWNPLIYWYKKNIRDTHEYIADAQVLKSTDTESYGSLLVGSAQSGLQLSLANHFIYSQLKNRIDMMLKDKSKKSMIWKYALILPALFFLVVLFAYKTPEKGKNEEIQLTRLQDSLPSNVLYLLNGKKVKLDEIKNIAPDQISSMNVIKSQKDLEKYGDEGKNGVIEIFTKTNAILLDRREHKIIDSNPREIFKVVEESPRFPGCENLSSMDEKKKCADEKMLQFLYQNIRYPLQAKNENIQGRAVITFVIEKDGRITDAEIVRDLGGGCGVEALRVINLMNSMPENWIPGKQSGKSVAVQYNIPIAFKLSGNSPANLPPSANSFDQNVSPAATSQLILKSKTGEDIYKVVEEAPRFPGCENLNTIDEKKKCADEKMLQFLYQNIKYPDQAKKDSIQGRAVISFVIEKDGRITDAEIIRDLGGGCGAEALRVINLMNSMSEKWIPGKQGGKSVAVQYNIPIAFRLSVAVSTQKEDTKSSEIDKSKSLSTGSTTIVKDFANQLKLIPNPANKKVDVIYDQGKNIKIEIIDLSGRVVHKGTWDNFGGRQSIDISNLANGTYLVRVKEGNKLSEQKLVVQ